MPTRRAGVSASPRIRAESSMAETGAKAVNNEACAPVVRAVPAYQSRKPMTVGTRA